MRRLDMILPLSIAVASCARPAGIEVADVWARDTLGRTANAAAFMTITLPAPDRLLGASTPIAKKTDLMTMGGGDGAMEMKYLDGIDLPANRPVSLNPSGLHVWLAELHKPLKAGDTFALTLKFAKAGERQVQVSVIAPSARPSFRAQGTSSVSFASASVSG